MSAVTVAEMIALERAAMGNGWTEEQLLNLAGERLGRAIGRHYRTPGTVIGYLGKGHNAGDTLVALRILRDEFGWKIGIRNAFPIKDWAPLMVEKWDELGLRIPLDRPPAVVDFRRPLLLLDGLCGTGASGPLREPLARFSAEMQQLRETSAAFVAAIDLPSGIDPDAGSISPNTVRADITFMIANAKAGLLKADAANATGALAVVPVEPLSGSGSGDFTIISPQTMDCGKAPRPFDFHKGMAGRVTLVAGSRQYPGAAVMAATGALRGGAGLITLCVPEEVLDLVASKCPPEIIIRGIANPRELLGQRFDALVVGCGLGEMEKAFAEGLLELIGQSPSPVVVDADALNLIARTGSTSLLTARHVITPHPGEFKRLAPEMEILSREEAAQRFSKKHAAVLLLKGSRTLVTAAGEAIYCNSTGSPAMASGGQGDLLSGVIAALLARGESPLDAACLGAWVCGRSAEIGLEARHCSEESLVAEDVAASLGAAFKDWKAAWR